MSNQEAINQHLVAVVGAGPAGLFAARKLAASGVQVALLNRDIKPGGLAEYGIYHDKIKMKEGLRRQFRQILDVPLVQYYGNVLVGQKGDLSLNDLKEMGFSAVLVTVGAQGTKWLGLEGEDLHGVYHAKDLVYHYNKLPPFSQGQYDIGQRVALVGVGNVMMDIAHWVIRDLQVKEVIAVARRGPAEVKFTKKEMEYTCSNLDLDALEAELGRVSPVMEALGQDPQASREYILSGCARALPPISDTRFLFMFLSSPTRIMGDDHGHVRGLEVEDTTLVGNKDDPKAKGLGTRRLLEVDTVVFCIGDKVDDYFGLPVRWNAFVKHPNALFPVEGLSYEAYDPEQETAIVGVFVAGWSREASSGLVGVARKDGENGAEAVLAYLKTFPIPMRPCQALERLELRLRSLGKPIVTKVELKRLEEAERRELEKHGLADFKYATNEEMMAAMGLV